MSLSVNRTGSKVDIEVVIPAPTLPSIPAIPAGFPPSIPAFKLPKIPAALLTAEQQISALIKLINRLISAIPDIKIHLVIKLGSTTMVDVELP